MPSLIQSNSGLESVKSPTPMTKCVFRIEKYNVSQAELAQRMATIAENSKRPAPASLCFEKMSNGRVILSTRFCWLESHVSISAVNDLDIYSIVAI